MTTQSGFLRFVTDQGPTTEFHYAGASLVFLGKIKFLITQGGNMVRHGQVLDDGSTRMIVTQTAAESLGDIFEVHVTYTPGRGFPPPHWHPSQDEVFWVIEGELTVRLNEVEHRVTSGECITLGAGQVHQIGNPSNSRTVAIWQTRPALRTGEFFESLFAANLLVDAHDGLLELAREYADVVRFDFDNSEV